MYKKYHSIGIVLFMAYFLSSCALFAIQEQQERIASYCRIYGTVKPEVDNGKKLIVLLFKFNGGDVTARESWSLIDHFVNDRPGKWSFFTSPGSYLVTAFADINEDLIYQLDEPAIAPVPENIMKCEPGTVKTGIDLFIGKQNRINAKAPLDISKAQIRSSKQQLNVSLGQMTQVGILSTMDDPRFSDETAQKGLWRPLDFLIDGHAGLYFLEPYSTNKIPVLFIHGINGSPRNFTFLVKHMDRAYFQPWVAYYPCGADIDNIAQFIDQMLKQLQAQYKFDKIAIIAHSMGGLVSRGVIFKNLDSSRSLSIPLLITISTPWGGDATAKLGVDHAPTPADSWKDLAPGSRFLTELFYVTDNQGTTRRKLPDSLSNHLFFSFIESEAGDGTVSLASELIPEAQEEADRLYGYQRSHRDILNTRETAIMVNRLLDGIR